MICYRILLWPLCWWFQARLGLSCAKSIPPTWSEEQPAVRSWLCGLERNVCEKFISRVDPTRIHCPILQTQSLDNSHEYSSFDQQKWGTIFVYLHLLQIFILHWCTITRGERELPFPVIPGNTGLQFPFPKFAVPVPKVKKSFPLIPDKYVKLVVLCSSKYVEEKLLKAKWIDLNLIGNGVKDPGPVLVFYFLKLSKSFKIFKTFKIYKTSPF